MKDIPIIMSGPMVREIMAPPPKQPKTETRRIMDPQPKRIETLIPNEPYELLWKGETWTIEQLAHQKCPYGIPGDRLWVRECFMCEDEAKAQDIMNPGYGLYYKADLVNQNIGIRWKPSIHMKKWMARLWLTRKSPARIERLQDITDEGARAEGFSNRQEFFFYWDKLNEKRKPNKRCPLCGHHIRHHVYRQDDDETICNYGEDIGCTCRYAGHEVYVEIPRLVAENPWVWVPDWEPWERQ